MLIINVCILINVIKKRTFERVWHAYFMKWLLQCFHEGGSIALYCNNRAHVTRRRDCTWKLITSSWMDGRVCVCVLCGLPAAGKSTLGRRVSALAAERGWRSSVMHYDDLIPEYAFRVTASEDNTQAVSAQLLYLFLRSYFTYYCIF